MALKDALIAEIKHEAAATRRIMQAVPEDKFDWKPHEKSMTAGRLAAHIAEIPVWVNRSLEAVEFDFATASTQRNTYVGRAALLEVFEQRLAAALAVLENASDDALNEKYTVRRGPQTMFELPRKVLIRNFALNHQVHHRGQLSVYLRLLDIAVPGMYGPSADGI